MLPSSCAAAAVGLSGLLAGWLVLADGPGLLAGLGSGYGVLLIGKTLGLAALLAFGWHHRRRSLPRLAEVKSVAGRYTMVERNGRQARLLLAKNPAGWLEAFDVTDPDDVERGVER